MEKTDFIKRIKAAEASKSFCALPEYSVADTVSTPAVVGTLKEAFTRNFMANHGTVVENVEDLVKILRENKCETGVADAKLADTFGLENIFKLSRDFDRSNPDSFDFGISKASLAIAESGAIVLKDTDTDDRMITIAPWIHIAVLSEKDIVKTISDGLARTVDNAYAIYVAAPSKTSDVEGVLVEGVHGPGLQIAFITA